MFHSKWASAFLVALSVAVVQASHAQEKTADPLSKAAIPAEPSSDARPSPLSRLLMPLIKGHAGDVAVAVRHLSTGEAFEYRSTVPQGTASLIKLPIMIEAYRQAHEGKIALDSMIEMRADDMVQGSGILTGHFSAGTRLSLRDAIGLMIAFSDNTATNLVLDKISIPATCETMRLWGYPETRINSKTFRRDVSIDLARSERFGLGSTTAFDMVDLLAKLHANELVSPAASKAMLAHLAMCDDKMKFPAMLPLGTKIQHKTGSVAKIRTDAGLIESPGGTFALCVLTENNRDSRWSEDNDGNRLCALIAKATFDHFSSTNKDAPEPPSASSGSLSIGATGDLVEALQRTLNARIEPSPRLGVDGDFGPGTEGVVKSFQTTKQLAPTGIVDKATWDALGPLLMEDALVAEPEHINGEQLEKKIADDPSALPTVTCKAWTIADAATGQVLWNQDGDKTLDIASTTKIMTAYLVMRYCQQHPEALDETLIFSARADATVGSTSAVKAGERVKVRDLLYGLMLPSGNDASVAFAEHFGERIGDDTKGDDTEADNAEVDNAEADKPAYDRFIKAMNRAASELGMNQSRYVNPHGLTAAGHRSSCNDLVRLTLAARKLPLFREVTTCRQYGCRVTGEGGYQRNIKWENTNQLLPIAGYTGVKTGTTDAAGACLVSAAARGNRELICVVLGSAASASRYADTRNLYAWAWRKLEGN